MADQRLWPNVVVDVYRIVGSLKGYSERALQRAEKQLGCALPAPLGDFLH